MTVRMMQSSPKERQNTKETLLSRDSRQKLDKSAPRLTIEAPPSENGESEVDEDEDEYDDDSLSLIHI